MEEAHINGHHLIVILPGEIGINSTAVFLQSECKFGLYTNSQGLFVFVTELCCKLHDKLALSILYIPQLMVSVNVR